MNVIAATSFLEIEVDVLDIVQYRTGGMYDDALKLLLGILFVCTVLLLVAS